MGIVLQVIYVGLSLINNAMGLENLAQNIAFKGAASGSANNFGNNMWQADKAIDGRLEMDFGDVTCSITTPLSYKTAWWKFTLKQLSNVAYLKIFFKNITVNRHTGFSVFVFNETTYIPPSSKGDMVYVQDPSSCPKQVMYVTVNRVTQGIAIYNSKNPPITTSCVGYAPLFATIEICEVMVFGCKSQHYGENCSLCPLHCKDSECDAFNGSCKYGCRERFMERLDCSVCIDGYYGFNCEQMCGNCKTGTICNNVTGVCSEGCLHGWGGLHCDVCEKGFYCGNCTETCGSCKPGTYCHNVTGICPEGCDDHWNGSFCNDCKDGYYGHNCTHVCGKCSLVTSCNHVTGICPNGCQNHWNGSKCNICADGFYGVNCESNCGECLIGTICDRSTGVCPNGCRGNWTGPKCNGIIVERESTNICPEDEIPKTSTVFISIFSTLLFVFLIYVGVRIVNKRKIREDQRNNTAAKAVDNSQFYNEIADTKYNSYQKISSSPKESDYQEITITTI